MPLNDNIKKNTKAQKEFNDAAKAGLMNMILQLVQLKNLHDKKKD